MTLRNGDPGRVWEAIRAMIEYTVVGTGGTLALDIEPQGLLGAQTAIAHSGCRGSGTHSSSWTTVVPCTSKRRRVIPPGDASAQRCGQPAHQVTPAVAWHVKAAIGGR